jgi:hypothetical protein
MTETTPNTVSTPVPRPPSRARKILLRAFLGFVAVYLAFAGYIWWAMCQPSEKFGRVMMHMPGPVVFLAFPFETLWTRARAGQLRVGDAAPDFDLVKLDKTARIRLSELNHNQPVVLVFGSYT